MYLTPLDVKKYYTRAIERTYSAGQIIFYDGDAPTQVIFVKNGAVKFYDTDADGNEKIMHISGEGGIFPLFYAFEDKKKVDGFYAAIVETRVLLIPLVDFRAKLKSSAEYAFKTLRWYAEEMDHIVLRLKSLEKSSARQKILQALFYLSDQHATENSGVPKWYRINFPLTQQILADMTGLTRETVNVTLKDPTILRVVRIRHRVFEICREKVATILEQYK